MNQDSEQQTTLENKEQYQSWKEELQRLESIDWESEDAPDPDAAEYIGHRIEMLKADILAYQETLAIIKSANVTDEMDDGEYWNTIALANDAWNGGM